MVPGSILWGIVLAAIVLPLWRSGDRALAAAVLGLFILSVLLVVTVIRGNRL